MNNEMFTIQTSPIDFASFEQKLAEDGKYVSYVTTSLDTLLDWAALTAGDGYDNDYTPYDYIISLAVDSADAPEDYCFNSPEFLVVGAVDGEIVFKVSINFK